MSISNTQTYTSSPNTFTRFWRSPTLVVARFTLRSYVRSGWILGDVVFVWLAYAVFFLEFGGNVSYFFGTAGEALSVLSILSTVVMTQRAMSARVYLPLTRLTSRSAYVRGVILASSVLRIPVFLLLMIMAMSFHQFSPPPCNPTCITDATFSSMTLGAIGLLVNCSILSTLTVLLSIPIATRRIQIIFLAWFALVLYTNTSNTIAATYFSWARIPLAPLAACYNLGTTGFVDWYTLVLFLVAMGYIFVLTILAEFLLRKRDLISVVVVCQSSFGRGLGHPQGERPSHTTCAYQKRVRVWEGRSPCGRPVWNDTCRLTD